MGRQKSKISKNVEQKRNSKIGIKSKFYQCLISDKVATTVSTTAGPHNTLIIDHL